MDNTFKFIKPKYKWNFRCSNCNKQTSTTIWRFVQIGMCKRCRIATNLKEIQEAQC